ncbi:uncharacterized protein [Musca autumnalis]|uniref:uncharacterized protein n=1 Tax=Musca autumnalis TaxID=221902 RepID=UPI003CEC910D
MNKNTLWLMFVLLAMYLTLVFCEEQQQQANPENTLEDPTKDLLRSDSTDLLEDEARTRRRHHSMWGWHALAIAYLIKVKIVIVAFFVGSAVYLGLRYFWPHKCQPEIILDHPPPSFHDHHHDHIPYSSDHSDIISSSWGPSSPDTSYEPYSAYAGSYGGGGSSDTAPVGPAETSSAESSPQSYRYKREVVETVEEEEEEEEEEKSEGESRQMSPSLNEEKIGNFMFMFLGLDSTACRRRFICEMEYRSKANPLTAMAFRVIGRSFFGKYTNDHNEMGRANTFEECAAVNSECVFIENEEQNETNNEEESTSNKETEEEEQSEPQAEETEDGETTDEDLNLDLPIADAAANNDLENNNIEERANYQNLMAERRNSYWRQRVRGDRQF